MSFELLDIKKRKNSGSSSLLLISLFLMIKLLVVFSGAFRFRSVQVLTSACWPPCIIHLAVHFLYFYFLFFCLSAPLTCAPVLQGTTAKSRNECKWMKASLPTASHEASLSANFSQLWKNCFISLHWKKKRTEIWHRKEMISLRIGIQAVDRFHSLCLHLGHEGHPSFCGSIESIERWIWVSR